MERQNTNDSDVVDNADLERQNAFSRRSTRITYANDVDGSRQPRALRNSSAFRSRSRSRGEMSISVARRRSVDPALVLPPSFRTASFGIEEGKRMKAKAVEKVAKVAKHNDKKKDKKGKKEAAQEVDFQDLDYHTASLDELFKRFSTTADRGLSSSQVAQLIKTVGLNRPSPPPSHWFRKTFIYLYGGFGSILFIAAILIFISWKPLGQPPQIANLALAIVLVIVWLAQASFSFWQDFSSSQVMASITTMLPDQCAVVRDGSATDIDGTQVVPGDILRLKSGDKLPADVRFIEVSSDARFDRSILTGETVPLLASVPSTDDNYLETACIGMAGTHCVSGTSWGLVVETGDRTVFGRIAKLTSTPKSGMTPLQKEILYFVSVIVCLMLTMIIVVIGVWAGWLRKAHPSYINVPTLIVDCVSVAVAFIPEGLPIAVTASLTITANIMRRNKVLCKSLKTVETLGAVNVICSDKTGTLTRNQMSVTDYVVGKEPSSAADAPEKYGSVRGLQKLAVVSSVCNDAEFDASTIQEPIADRKVNGDATDSAILRFTEDMTSVSGMRGIWRTIFKIAFNSKNKFAITVAQDDNEENEKLMLIKGAPDILLPRCGSFMDDQGHTERLDQTERESLEALKDSWSSQGKRVILLAHKRVEGVLSDPENQPREYENEILRFATNDLVLVGMVAIVDPPRSEIPEVVRTLRGAGVRVFMVTGDFKLTAAAIAADCGIITQHPKDIDDFKNLTPEYEHSLSDSSSEKADFNVFSRKALVLSGADVEKLDQTQWDQVASYEEIVFARTTPDHKLRIVKELQKRDLTVGMTGDGVNDAPSLKQADVGIAMGSGSDIAIEAADMVLLESFAAIVEAVRYGRVVFDNLKKTICYLLPAGSFSEFWPVFTSVIFGLPQILSSFLMIIICCCTDCAAATALAYEKPEADVLMRPPRNAKKDRLVDWKLILQAYGFVGIVETVTSFTMSYWYAQKRGLTFGDLWFSFGAVPPQFTEAEYMSILNTASSIYFVNLVVMQWFNLLAVRVRRRSVLQHSINWYLPPAVVFALLIAIFFLYVPKFQTTLGTAVVPVQHWFYPIAFGIGLLLLDESRKWLARKFPNTFLAKVAW